jgi:predicted nucleic acid-binding protein
VLVSAAIARGTPHRLLLSWVRRNFGLVVSPHLLYELEAVLLRQKFRSKLSYEDVLGYVSWLHDRARVSEGLPADVVKGTTGDPDDDYLVGLAALPGVSYLVSGDPHLLSLPDRFVKYGDGRALARVMTPREFLNELR